MSSSGKDKIKIKDIVHGEIEFEPYFRDIIAREEFQRLHNVKQLGSAYMVYGKLTGSRYEHSIGVSYLANKLIDTLERNSKTEVPLFYRKCVTIAGLLHDLGHGPFSHMWEYLMENYFNENHHHEDISCRMVDRVFSHVTNVFDIAEEHDRGVRLIKSIIQGNLGDLEKQLGKDMYVAEIVSNKYSEIDVDRVDYILRDAYYAQQETTIEDFDPEFSKFLENAQIIEGPDGVKHIYYLESDLKTIYNFFKNRMELHRQVYQHSTVIASQTLLCDFFKAADDNNFKFNDTFRLNKITDPDDLTAYITFDDTVLTKIMSQLTATTGQYETLKRLIKNKQNFCEISAEKYDELRSTNKYDDDQFRVHEVLLEDPFKKFKTFLDRNLLYNRNNNRVINNIDEVKRKLNLNVNRALENDSIEKKLFYLVDPDF